MFVIFIVIIHCYFYFIFCYIPVFCSLIGSTAPVETKTEILMLDGNLKTGGVYEHPLPTSYNGFVYCYKGEGQ